MPNQKQFYQGIDLHGNELSNAQVLDTPVNPTDIVNLDYLQNYVEQELESSGLTPAFKEGYVKFLSFFIYSGTNRLSNQSIIKVNTNYNLLILVESVFNNRPATTSPSISLNFISDSSSVQLQDVTFQASNYGIILESNQFLLQYTSTTSNNLLLKTNCTFTLSQDFDATIDEPIFTFIRDISSNIFNNIQLIISPYFGLNTQTEIITDPIINSSYIPELGINTNIGPLVNKTSLFTNSLNSFVVLVPQEQDSFDIEFTNGSNQIFQIITIPTSDLLTLGDGTPLQQTSIIWNGLTYKKGLLHLGYITQSDISIRIL